MRFSAAVSRQREFLADASAVQFTRNPDSIAGALKRIGGDAYGSILDNAHTAEISHALFSQGISTYLNGLFATHPPLVERIRRIDKYWDGQFERPEIEAEAEISADNDLKKETAKSAAIITGMTAVLNEEKLAETVAQPSYEQLDYAHQLIAQIPADLKQAAHEPCGARALIYFLVLDDNAEMRKKQLHHLMAYADPAAYKETIKLSRRGDRVLAEHRLPLIDMALASLRQLSQKQYQLFKGNLEKLTRMDNKLSLFEWMIEKIVLHHLDRVFEKQGLQKDNLTIAKTLEASASLLSLLAFAGSQKTGTAEEAFAAAKKQLGEFDIQLIQKNELNLDKLNQALEQLARLKPLQKPALLKACAACILADKYITQTQSELFRAIADAIDCPMPPLTI